MQKSSSPVYRENLAAALSWLGDFAYHKGDYNAAAEYFREAIKNDPSHPNWVAFLNAAEQKIQAAEMEAERRRQDAATAQQMRSTIGNLANDIASSPVKTTPGLDFASNSSAAGNKNELQFGDPSATSSNGNKNPFGAGNANVSAGTTPVNSTPGSGSTSATKQAVSGAAGNNVFDGQNAPNVGGLNTATTSSVSSTQQCTSGCLPDNTPARLKNDKKYVDLWVEKEKLDKRYHELDGQLTEIRKQQRSGQGDQKALADQYSQASNQIVTVHAEQVDNQEKRNKMLEDDSAAPLSPADDKPPAHSPQQKQESTKQQSAQPTKQESPAPPKPQ
jgi:tetratricopeptide (TPR) repeat protein